MVDLKNKNKGCGEKWTQWYVWSSAKKKKEKKTCQEIGVSWARKERNE